MTVRLTPTQLSEVAGLLDVAEEERAEWGAPWGQLDGDTLTVHDPAVARSELLLRAAWNEQEGYVNDSRSGTATARSLRGLADKITEGAS